MPNGRLSLVTVGREDQRQTRTYAITSQLVSVATEDTFALDIEFRVYNYVHFQRLLR